MVFGTFSSIVLETTRTMVIVLESEMAKLMILRFTLFIPFSVCHSQRTLPTWQRLLLFT